MRIAVLDDYHHVARDLGPWDRLRNVEQLEVHHDRLVGEALFEALHGVDVVALMRERTPIPGSLLDRLPDLRLLVTAGRSNAAIDLEAATRSGIIVSGTPGDTNPMPELAWGLLFALLRDIPAHDRNVRAGRWQMGMRLGSGLHGRRLGFVGLGRTGAIMARQAVAFGAEVVAWSPHLTDERAAAAGVHRVGKDELFRSSDIVIVLLRLAASTRGLVGTHELSVMKPTAYLVNTSRGPIVDEDALISALHERTIAGAGLDVFDREPLPADHPLLAFDNTVLTPHIGYVTREHMALFYGGIVKAIEAFQSGAPTMVLNPEVLGQ